MGCNTAVDWLYRLDESFSWESNYEIPEDLVFRDRSGAVRLIVETTGRITVTREYAWNGASPKFCVFDLMLGTPEGVVHAETGRPKTYHASLVHDALYQFLPEGLPLKRKHADDFFYRLLKEADFAPARLYWLAVRLFGWIVQRATKRKRGWRGSGDRLEQLLSAESAADG